jgi:hypothetical protein
MVNQENLSILFHENVKDVEKHPGAESVLNRLAVLLPDFFYQLSLACPFTVEYEETLIENLSFNALTSLRLLSDHLVKTAPPNTTEKASELENFLLFLWSIVRESGRFIGTLQDHDSTCRLVSELLLTRPLEEALRLTGPEYEQASHALQGMIRHQGWFSKPRIPLTETIQAWLSDDYLRQYLHINTHNGVVWFHQENFERLLYLMYGIALADWDGSKDELNSLYQTIKRLDEAKQDSGFRVDKLISILES